MSVEAEESGPSVTLIVSSIMAETLTHQGRSLDRAYQATHMKLNEPRSTFALTIQLCVAYW